MAAVSGNGEVRIRPAQTEFLAVLRMSGRPRPRRSPVEVRRSVRHLPARCGCLQAGQWSDCTALQRFCHSPTALKSPCPLLACGTTRRLNARLAATLAGTSQPRSAPRKPAYRFTFWLGDRNIPASGMATRCRSRATSTSPSRSSHPSTTRHARSSSLARASCYCSAPAISPIARSKRRLTAASRAA